FDLFFTRALAKQPGDRFQNPRAFVEAIEALPTPERAPISQPNEDQLGALVTAAGQVFLLTAPDMIIGRSDPQRGIKPDIDLLPLDPAQTVSRQHARIACRSDRYYLEDLKAFNRTRVNGMPLIPHQ